MDSSDRYAPGWPGIPARWTSSAKSCVGTALSSKSRVWFTLSHGILNEIYYPRIDQACVRDVGMIVNKGDNFEVRLTVEGVYDYYCIPHEASGMVGRIIVSGSKEADPASFAPYPDNPGREEWKTIPDAALRNFPPIPAILKRGRTGGLVEHHIHVNNK